MAKAGALDSAPSVEASATAEIRRPNIIYILADDLGYGDLGAYGQRKIQTPGLDSLADEGVRFTQHYAGSSVCGPSRASLLTGLHSGHSPIRGNPVWTNSGKPVDLKPDDITIAEMLQENGYHTAAIGKWGMSESPEQDNLHLPSMPNQQGFDYFYGLKTHLDAHHYYWHRLFENNEPFELTGNDYKKNEGVYIHDLFTEKAIEYVEKQDGQQPFFLYLSYMIPHLAVTVPEDSKQQYLKLGWPERKMNTDGHYRNDPEGNTAYAGMVSRMDRDIARLMETLQKKGIDQNTLVIFTSDNGHEYDTGFFDSNGPLRGKKRDLYEGGIRVPFIAKWPAQITPGTESDHVSAFWDMMPTFCEFAEAESCPSNDGVSMRKALFGVQGQAQHSHLYWEFNEREGPIQAVRQGDWKLIKKYRKPLELYNLAEDVSEANNLATSKPELAEQLSQLADASRTYHPEFTLRKLPNPYKKKKVENNND
ncbi:arylsulfatase [Microbulbifer agarilyticus]|uniref:arylsulfatase n=1 Tax=Microbulbifer agarilyticus TaxID=260552 RepID=UPI001CD5AD6B|nr:arylsulfatase [Microbulbifer agarilyticus]MCA0892141.1 arylsulfatase [Microbulbifer agarilyticus]MCA0900815.1 arylsulfatase [Microbulbifer agarilyticus]